jgi:SepF-like predicted cell division protein (DUF552 family)
MTTTKTPKKTKTDTQFEQLLSEITKVSARIDRLESASAEPVTAVIEPVITPIEPVVTAIEPVTAAIEPSVTPIEAVTVKMNTVAISRKIYILLIIVVVLSVLSHLFDFFRNAPVNRGRSELTAWTKQQAQELPTKYRSEIKAIMKESYSETAAAIRSREITTTSDARTRLSQLIQAKILSLNRLSKNPQELETIIQAMKPLSEAIGERLESDVDAGKMQDSLESVQKSFSEIAEGMR